MAAPRILTFNFHEPYLCLMAEIGYPLYVGTYDTGLLARPWHTEYRPLPPAITLLPESQWRQELKEGRFDLAIAQNENNALDIFRAPCPKILLCHNRRNFLEEAAVVDEGDPKELFGELVVKLQEAYRFVFISESKRESYGVPGRVILPGFDVEAWGGYTGETATVLRVGNMMRERNLMFDVDVQESVCAGLPGRVAGFNPGIPDSQVTGSFEELIQLYRTHRCLLHVTREAFEDGYNLAMVEAMACGMPVVTLANATSPITGGVDGLVGADAQALRAHVETLLGDLDTARAIGAKGRETVARKFPLEAFRENWQAAIEEAIEGASSAKRAAKPQRKLLLEYMASPITTGRYFEEAAREKLDVTTAGFRVPEKLLEAWGFKAPIPAYPPHAVYVPLEHSFAQVRTLLPDDYAPDLYLWIDSGPKEVPEGIEELPCPKIAYLIDTHIAPEVRLEMARHFDVTFIAQKAQLDWFRAAGVKNIFWLPLACSPRLHQVATQDRTLDIAYVGSLGEEEGNRRRILMDRVREHYPNHFVGRAWPHEMAEIYARAKIVVNACVYNDLNMRVFEGMAAGALVLTDEAEGLRDLFEDGRHVVVYHGEADLLEKIAWYLEHPEEREAIASAGQALVLREHTYSHRLEEMLHMTDEILGERAADAEEHWDPDGYYQCPRPELMPHIPLHAQRVLDVGCGAGAFGLSLKRQAGVKFVAGLEIVPAAAEKARRVLDEVVLGNIEEMDLPWEENTFDCIVCADVLEHLIEPVPAIQKLAKLLTPEGVLVISMPNTQFYEAVAMLSYGQWTYMDKGIMDRTHLRFYTRSALAKLMADAGMQVAQLAPLSAAGPEKLPRQEDGSVKLGKLHYHNLTDDEYNDLLVYQYLIVGCKPGVDRLARARQALDIENNEAAYALALDAVGVDEVERHQIAAKALARMGQLEQAEQHYQHALKLKPNAINVAGEYGILLVAMNRVSEAKPLLERTLDEKQGSDRVLGAMGLVLLTEGRHAEAFDCFGRALEANYDNISLLRHYIDTAELLGRNADAEPLVRRFAEFYPGKTELACEHAKLLLELGRMEEARDRLEMVLLLSPRNQPAQDLLKKLDSEGEAP
jgi:glycosyltransferase involved in cell wall biosynthesis/SAM-dependent methyltransferase/Tfp pilus assembly protein PilF